MGLITVLNPRESTSFNTIIITQNHYLSVVKIEYKASSISIFKSN